MALASWFFDQLVNEGVDIVKTVRFQGHRQRDIRRHNINTVLQLLRDHAPLSRTDIAQRTGLTKATISALVSHFESLGVVRSAGTGTSDNGPKPRLLELNARYRCIVGVDLSDTCFSVGITDLSGTLLASPQSAVYHADADLPVQVFPLVDAALLTAQALELPVAGVGVAISGLVDPDNGIVWDSTVFAVEDLALQQVMENRYRLPVRIDGDVHVRLQVELRRKGLTEPDAHVVYVYVGTGIGASLYLNGQIHRGGGGFAGEIGHIAVAEGPVCACGHHGCLEAVASWPALPRHMAGGKAAAQGYQLGAKAEVQRAEPGDKVEAVQNTPDTGLPAVTPEVVVSLAQSGDHDALQACEKLAFYLGKGLSTLVNIVNPDVIIIGGPLAQHAALFAPALHDSLRRFSLAPAAQRLRLLFADDVDDIGIKGAADLLIPTVFQSCLPPAPIPM